MATDILVMGIGNDLRGDDRVGLVLARAIRARQLPHVRVVECDGDITTWLMLWASSDTVVMLDAVVAGSEPGALHQLDVSDDPLPAAHRSPSSSHVLDVGQIVELARTLHRLPRRLLVFGVEGKDFGHGTDISPAVLAALPTTISAVVRAINTITPDYTEADTQQKKTAGDLFPAVDYIG